jgi:hypothetical protein
MCRVPCEYKHRNLSVRVEDKSRAPGDLAIRFLYQGGQTDIVAVDVAQVRYTAVLWMDSRRAWKGNSGFGLD